MFCLEEVSRAGLPCGLWPLLKKPFRTRSGAVGGRGVPSARLNNEQNLSLVPKLRRSPQKSRLSFSFHSEESPVFLASVFFSLAGVVQLPLWKHVSHLALTC